MITMSYRVVEAKPLPYSYVKEKLRELIDSGNSSQAIQRVFDYLNEVSKCSGEDAMKVMDELSSLLPKEEVRAVLSSICPKTPDEVRSILAMDTSKTYSTDDVNKIIEIISKYLRE